MKRDHWSREYRAYCRAHGEDNPRAMLAEDARKSPDFPMADFHIWLRSKP